MHFPASENFPGAVAELRQAGHDVLWVRADAPGLSDADVLAWAVRKARILLTFDKDFGDLARVAGLPKDCGVILFRGPVLPADVVGRRRKDLVPARSDGAGHFSIIEPGRVRMRPLG